jgi:hypothetical protein
VPDRNGNPDTRIELEDAGGELIVPGEFATMRGIEAAQLAVACQLAFGTSDPGEAASKMADEEYAWIRQLYRHTREPERTWEAWWFCYEHEGAHFIEGGLVFLGGTADELGIHRYPDGLQLVSLDPEVAALYEALLRVT